MTVEGLRGLFESNYDAGLHWTENNPLTPLGNESETTRQAEEVLHSCSTLLTIFASNCHVNAPKGPRGNYDLCRIADHAVEK